MFEPVIKWSGSKRSQAENILTYFPKEIDTYYEPFCGGASVLRRLLMMANVAKVHKRRIFFENSEKLLVSDRLRIALVGKDYVEFCDFV